MHQRIMMIIITVVYKKELTEFANEMFLLSHCMIHVCNLSGMAYYSNLLLPVNNRCAESSTFPRASLRACIRY